MIDNRHSIVPKLNLVESVFYVKHPKYTGEEVNTYKKQGLLKDLSHKDMFESLFILDFPGHTFFYQAVYQCIPFVLYYNRDWKKYFTNEYNELLTQLEAQRLLFFWDQEVDFLKHVSNLLSSQNYNKSYFELSRSFLIN